MLSHVLVSMVTQNEFFDNAEENFCPTTNFSTPEVYLYLMYEGHQY